MYRVYDYDRLGDDKPRDLHLAQSLEVIDAQEAPTSGKLLLS